MVLPIYSSSGTGQKIITLEGNVNGLVPVSFTAKEIKGRDELLAKLKSDANAENCVLLMGARDPLLPALVMDIVVLLGGEINKS